jgi:hypothetical protein
MFDRSIRARKLSTLSGILVAGFALGCSEGTGMADGDDGDDTSSASSSTGTGGTTSGSATSSGATGGGTTGSTGGGPADEATMRWDFSDGAQGWAFNFADMAASEDLGANTTVVHDTDDDADPNSSSPGSLLVTIPFTEVDERVGIAINVGLAIDEMGEPIDLTDKTLHASVKLVEGFGTNVEVPGGAKLYVKAGPDYALANHGWTNMETVGRWVSVTLDVSNPAGHVDPVDENKDDPYDPADVREIGVEFAASDVDTGTWTTAVLRIDDVWY